MRRWAPLLVGALVSVNIPGARAQVPFDKATAPSYITYCLEAATGLLPSAGCNAGTYAVIQEAVTQALQNPNTIDPQLLDQLDAICEADCLGELLTMVRMTGAHVSQLTETNRAKQPGPRVRVLCHLRRLGYS